MDQIPIPYFGMLMSLLVAPGLTFGFILFLKKIKADVEIIKTKKEILELEIKKEEIHLNIIQEESKKLDKLIEDHTLGKESIKSNTV
ncbi:MAG: hypothetical protein ACYDEX_21705 [Mobilitalea sp.]